MSEWVHKDIDGRKTGFVDISGRRLYVTERFKKVEAWVDGKNVGVYVDFEEAQRAAMTVAMGRTAPKPRVGELDAIGRSKGDPYKYTPPVKREVPFRPRIDGRETQLKQFPIADMSAPIATITEVHPDGSVDFKISNPPLDKLHKAQDQIGGLSQSDVWRNPQPHSAMQVIPAWVPPKGWCQCGAKLGRSGKCPALCEPVSAEEVKPYSGPRLVGLTHLGKIGAPVR